MSTVQSINRNNLKTARENMGLDTESASQKISRSNKNIVAEWEDGKSLPSWSQIDKLAKLYNIPELLFFSDELIQKNKSIPDYRVGTTKRNDEQVKKLINLVISRQRWLERLLKSEGYEKNRLQGSGNNIYTPKELANLISKELDIDISDIKKLSRRKDALSYFIEKAESKGVFVGKTISYHRLEVDDLRGLFISNDYCPFIIINRRDALSAQIFSFAHELAHLFRKSDAISNSLEFRSNTQNINKEEIFCNKVAAELLLPEQDFINSFYNKTEIDSISNTYKVSQLFVFYRLKELGKIHGEIQDELEYQIQRETEESLRIKTEKDKTKKGGDYTNSMKDSNGSLFNRTVYASYLENKIGYVEASKLLRFSPEMV
jgi:Zn-dependent peptidase ImmA (M78 family)/transcriptional regulator with XRE-family HTH domain